MARRSNRTFTSPVPWEQIDPESRQAIAVNMAQMGMAASHLDVAKEAATQALEKTDNPYYGAKQQRRLGAIEKLRGHLVDKPITLRKAAKNRADLVLGGIEEAKVMGAPAPRGAGWYFQHHADIMDAARRQGGFSPERAITATTMLSPQNDPATEVKAGEALMGIVNNPNHTVSLSPQAFSMVNAKLKRMTWERLPEELNGGTMRLGDLSSEHIAGISSMHARLERAGHAPLSTASFKDAGSSQLDAETERAVRVLRGELHPDEAILPHGSPKVFTYRGQTLAAVPSSAVHGEYSSRMSHLTKDPNQGMLDLWGLRHSKHPLLSAQGSSVEDSWQHAISTGQRLEKVDTGGKGLSPAKFAAGDPNIAGVQAFRKAPVPGGPTVGADPHLTPSALIHAFNVKATRSAAASMPIQMGNDVTDMPAMAVQEQGWTQGRIKAGKDPAYNAEQREMAAQNRNLSRGQFKGQGKLF